MPAGQFRLIVTTSDPAAPTGDFVRSFSASVADTRMVYSAGIGTDEIIFPDDVGIRVWSDRRRRHGLRELRSATFTSQGGHHCSGSTAQARPSHW